MGVVLSYSKTDGQQDEVEYEIDVESITISRKKIVTIDLTPLASCKELKKIDLSDNSIQSLNLNPLGSCYNLTKFVVYMNQLQKIDLSPLSSCINLQEFNIHSNPLGTIDLNPLSSISALEAIILANCQFQEIDLTPLSFCSNLQRISLHDNLFTHIDLTPLVNCPNLQSLNIGGNRFETFDLTAIGLSSSLQSLSFSRGSLHDIDLEPLGSCRSLSALYLEENHLRNIDLSPLSSCKRLEILTLNNNELKYIDLTPLSDCRKLKALEVQRNQIKHLDLTPLSTCSRFRNLSIHRNQLQRIELSPLHLSKVKSLWLENDVIKESILSKWIFGNDLFRDKSVKFDAPSRMPSLAAVEYAFPLVRKKHVWKTIHLFNEALRLLDLDWMGQIDTPVEPILRKIFEIEKNSARELTFEMLVPLLRKQIDNGGTTIKLDVDRMVLESPDLAHRFNQVINLRQEEMKGVSIVKIDDQFDVQSLWLTAYGHQILSTLGCGLVCDMNEFGKIRTAVEDVGFKLQITNSEQNQFPTNISEDLREYILYVSDSDAEELE